MNNFIDILQFGKSFFGKIIDILLKKNPDVTLVKKALYASIDVIEIFFLIEQKFNLYHMFINEIFTDHNLSDATDTINSAQLSTDHIGDNRPDFELDIN